MQREWPDDDEPRTLSGQILLARDDVEWRRRLAKLRPDALDEVMVAAAALHVLLDDFARRNDTHDWPEVAAQGLFKNQRQELYTLEQMRTILRGAQVDWRTPVQGLSRKNLYKAQCVFFEVMCKWMQYQRPTRAWIVRRAENLVEAAGFRPTRYIKTTGPTASA